MTGLAALAGRHNPARARQLEDAFRTGGFEVVEMLSFYGSTPAARRPAVVVWPGDGARELPLGQSAVHVVDLAGAVRAHGLLGAARQAAWRTALVESCRGAQLVLVGSDGERGFWSAELMRAGISAPIVEAPFAMAAPARAGPFGELTIVLDGAPDPGVLARVAEAARWATQRGGALRIAATPGHAGLDGLLAAQRLRDLAPGVPVENWQPGAALPGPLLDLRDDTAETRITVPAAVVCALAQGFPVISAVQGALARRIAAAGAGLVAASDWLDAALDQFAALSPAQQAAMGGNAARLAQEAFAPERVGHALVEAVRQALALHETRFAAWRNGAERPGPQPLGAGSHVLVLSDEEENLRDIRVHLTFGAMHRRGVIGGYSVLHRGEFIFSTRAGSLARMPDDARFDAVWVHRGHSAGLQLVLQILDRPFVFDIDDNLLSAPSYRPPFSPKAIEAVRGMVGACTALSCSTARLAGLLQRGAGVALAHKAVVTPNLVQGPPMQLAAGLPRALVWASSDVPALTGARSDVLRAVRDFCLAHRLRVVCMGAPPPEPLRDAGLEIEHVGILPYAGYLEFLRALSPSILVCPLETDADPATQDFVDGKSDVKLLDALLAGMVGVFSDARPYRDSELGPAILCANSYDAWLDGLERAYRACGQADAPAPWPADREASGAGLMAWAEALGRVRLRTPLRLAEVRAAIRYVEKRQARFLEAHEFDAAYYLAVHDDVRVAVETGGAVSAYEHYLSSGHRERRDARSVSEGQAGTAAWWSVLMHQVDRLEAEVESRAAAIEQLQADQATRRALAMRP